MSIQFISNYVNIISITSCYVNINCIVSCQVNLLHCLIVIVLITLCQHNFCYIISVISIMSHYGNTVYVKLYSVNIILGMLRNLSKHIEHLRTNMRYSNSLLPSGLMKSSSCLDGSFSTIPTGVMF